jgi:murein DD-endopeptidase MepM/ murein hydrolase activator NlpD
MAGWSVWGYGNVVYLDNGNGVETLYAHMSKINVSVGQQVTRDTVIGYVGSTGRSSGPHLHFEIHKNKVPFNPLAVINPFTP